MMKILLSNKKLKVDQRDGDGETPVFVAVDSGHAGLVSLLLDAGAANYTKAEITPRI